MKRKREKKLNPCEEKALVHLQALQIKEKEAKARSRAKKKKEGSSAISLTGQQLPSQTQPITESPNFPLFSTPNNPLPTRNEWDQLIPFAAQTAQFAILNHAMQQQGIRREQPPVVNASRPPVVNASRPPVVNASRPPVVNASQPPAPSEIEMADFSYARSQPLIPPQRGPPQRGPVRARMGVPSGVISAFGRGLGALRTGAIRGSLAFGRGAVKAVRGLSAVGSAIGTGAARVATSLGGVIDELKIQNTLRQKRKLMNKYNEELEMDNLKRKLANLTVPNNDSNVLHNQIHGDDDIIPDVPEQNKDEDIIDEFNEFIPPKDSTSSKKSSSIEMQNISSPNRDSPNFGLKTPPKKTLEVTSFAGAKSPYVKIINPADDFQSKKFRAGNQSNTTEYLLSKDQDFRKNIYEQSKLQPSVMRTPAIGSDSYAKLDDNYALDKFGNIVSRNDYQTLHPAQQLEDSKSTYTYDTKTESFKSPLRFKEVLTNQNILDFFQDKENLTITKQWLNQGWHPRITSHHWVNKDGEVEDLIPGTKQSFDPNAENTYFSELYQQIKQNKPENTIFENDSSSMEAEPEEAEPEPEIEPFEIFG